MTKEKLSKLYYLEKEYEDLKDRLDEMEASGISVTASINGMPKGSSPGDKVGRCAAAVADSDLPRLVGEAYVKCLYERTQIWRYINTIDDPLIRLIIRKRYLELKEWEDVASEISYQHTEDSVRKTLDRFLENH